MSDQILAGSVAVGVVPSAQGFAEKLRAAIVPDSAKIGEQAAKMITDAIRAKLAEFKGAVSVEADTAPATAEIDKLRGEAEKPAVMPVKIKTEGGAGGSVGTTAALEAEGAKAGSAVSAGYNKKLKEGLNKAGKFAAESVAGIVAGSVYEGIKLQHGAELLVAAEHSRGIAVAANKPIIDAQAKSMEQYGVTTDEAYMGLTKLISTGVPLSMALQTQSTAAKVAAATGTSYTSVIAGLVKGGGTATRMLKQLGLAQIQGKDQATAFASASTFLSDRIQQAGGMAAFAAQHHLSLAKSIQLVSDASGASTRAQQQLAAVGLSAKSASTLLTGAQDGNAASLKKLTALGMTQNQLQGLITASASGNIEAYNKLGIEVLPKTNTITENLTQSTRILSNMYGGQAKAATEGFAGKVKAMKAEFTDVGARLGTQVIPLLSSFMKILANPVVLKVVGAVVALVAAFWSVTKVVGAMNVVLGVFNIELDANPIGLVVIAIAALVIGVILAYKHFKIFREVVQAVWGWIKAHWPLLLVIILGPVGLAVVGIIKHFGTVKKVVSSTFDWIKNTWSKIYDAISGPFTKAFDYVKKAFTTFYNNVIKPVISTIGTVLGWLGLGGTGGVSGPGNSGPAPSSKGTGGSPPSLSSGTVPAPRRPGHAAAASLPALAGSASTAAADAAAHAKALAAHHAAQVAAVKSARAATAVASTAARTQSAASQAQLSGNYSTSAAQLRVQESAALAAAAAGAPKGATAASKTAQSDAIRIAFQKKLDALRMAELGKRAALRIALLKREEQLYPAKAAQYEAQIAAFKQQDAIQRGALSKQNAVMLNALSQKQSASAAKAGTTTSAVTAAAKNWISGPLGTVDVGPLSSRGSTLGGVPTLGSAVGASTPLSTGSGLSGGSSVVSAASVATSGGSAATSQAAWEKSVVNHLEAIVTATNQVGRDVGMALNGQGRTSASRAARITQTRGG